ncbi:MAG: phosphoribosylglycinamide formyltransferase [Ktedonobacteraceae bacterium]
MTSKNRKWQESYDWKITRKKHTQSDPDEPAHKALRLGILVSGNGSNLQAIIDAIESQELPGVEIALVVSNNAHAYGLQRALKHTVPVIYMPWSQREECELRLTSLLQLFNADLIILAGWMRILSGAFLEQFPDRVINLHPALLPDDGMGHSYITQDGTEIPVFRGLHAVRQALDAGVKVTGSTVHYVTPEVDAGPVICREEVAIEPDDTEEQLHERLKSVEHRLIVKAVRLCQENIPE